MDKNRLFLLRKPKLISRIALYQIPLKFLLKYDDFLPKIRYNKERKTGVSPGGKERKVMKHRKCKRTLCAMLCAAMVASTMCTASFAADGPPAGESSTSSSMSEPPGSSTSSETETLLEESGVPETEESLSADTQQILDANVQKTPAEGNGKRNNAARGSPRILRNFRALRKFRNLWTPRNLRNPQSQRLRFGWTQPVHIPSKV